MGVGKGLINIKKIISMERGSAFAGDLSLWNKNIDAKACEHLASALAKMTALKSLDLRYNQIDAEACKHLSRALGGDEGVEKA